MIYIYFNSAINTLIKFVAQEDVIIFGRRDNADEGSAVRVKLSPHLSTKPRWRIGGVEVELHEFLPSSLDESEGPA
jgi:hypothetical protein